MSTRIQLSRKKAWRKPPNSMSIARPGKWGNQYLVIDLSVRGAPLWAVRTQEGGEFGEYPTKREATERAVELFRIYVKRQLLVNQEYLEPLRGKVLCCWCRLDWPCHGDVYLEYFKQLGKGEQ